MQLNATAGRGIGRRLFELPRFGAWRTISEDEYRVSASYGNGALVIEYSFFFRGQQKDFVGFDLISYSVIDPQFGQVVGLALEFVLRLEHSNRLPLSCSKFSTLSSFYTNCSSDVLSSPLLVCAIPQPQPFCRPDALPNRALLQLLWNFSSNIEICESRYALRASVPSGEIPTFSHPNNCVVLIG